MIFFKKKRKFYLDSSRINVKDLWNGDEVPDGASFVYGRRLIGPNSELLPEIKSDILNPTQFSELHRRAIVESPDNAVKMALDCTELVLLGYLDPVRGLVPVKGGAIVILDCAKVYNDAVVSKKVVPEAVKKEVKLNA